MAIVVREEGALCHAVPARAPVLPSRGTGINQRLQRSMEFV